MRPCGQHTVVSEVPMGPQDREGLSYLGGIWGEAFVGKREHQEDPQKPCVS